MEEKKFQRRWYDKDPMLKEALELLRLAPIEKSDKATKFLTELQENVALDVLEKVCDIMGSYGANGHRWYDSDPVVMRAIKLLRSAPKKTQKEAALKLLTLLEKNDGDTEQTRE